MSVNALHSSFSLWAMRRPTNNGKFSDAGEFERSIKKLLTFNTVEEFWGMHLGMKKLCDIEYLCDFHLFREGIKPIWEDTRNKHGGKLTIRIKKNPELVHKYWETLLLMFIGERLDPRIDDVCGVIASVRSQEVLLSVWISKGDDNGLVGFIKERLKHFLGLVYPVKVEYRKHNNDQRGNKPPPPSRKPRGVSQIEMAR